MQGVEYSCLRLARNHPRDAMLILAEETCPTILSRDVTWLATREVLALVQGARKKEIETCPLNEETSTRQEMQNTSREKY